MLTTKVDGATSPFAVRVGDPFQRVIIKKSAGSEFILNGLLHLYSYMGARDAITISLGKRSRLIIVGDLEIGNGTTIFLDEGAFLRLDDKRHESAAGITERSRIMVKKHVQVGNDCIIA